MKSVKELLNFVSELPKLMGSSGVHPKNLDLVRDIRQVICEWERYKELEERGKLLELHCAVGDTVFIFASCECVISAMDRDTGFTECPFESDCEFDECDNSQRRVFKTTVSSIFDDGHGMCLSFEGLCITYPVSDIGRVVFLNEQGAKNALEKQAE